MKNIKITYRNREFLIIRDRPDLPPCAGCCFNHAGKCAIFPALQQYLNEFSINCHNHPYHYKEITPDGHGQPEIKHN